MGAGRRAFYSLQPSLSLPLFARPHPHVRACARLNLAEVEDFQGKTCIAFYRRIDHLNNSQHRKPRPDRVLRLSLSLFLSCPFSISSLLFRSLSFSRGLALDHSKSVSLAFLLAPLAEAFPCSSCDHPPQGCRERRRAIIDLYVCAPEEGLRTYTCIRPWKRAQNVHTLVLESGLDGEY